MNLSHRLITPEYWSSKNSTESLRETGIITGLITLFFFLVGLPFNIMIIVSVILKKLYKEPTQMLLLSLTAADLLVCVFVMPLIIIAGFSEEFIFGTSDYTRCKVCQAGITLVALTFFSLFILALISLDRCIYIKLPLRYYKLVTPRKTLTSVMITFILSISISVLPLFGFGDIYYDPPTFTCTPRFEHKTNLSKNIYYVVLILVMAIFPISTLIVTNTWVICIAQKQIKKMYKIIYKIDDEELKLQYHLNIKSKLQQEKYRKELQLLRVFGAIFIANVITWVPLIVRIIEASVQDSDEFSPWSNSVLIISLISQSVLHPLIEASLIPEVRKYLCICSSLCINKPVNLMSGENIHPCCNNCHALNIAVLPSTALEQ